MIALRRLVFDHRRLFATLVFAALAMRMLTPAGYMFAVAGGVPTVRLCPGTQPAKPAPHAMAMPAGDGHHDGGSQDRADMPCAFAGPASAVIAATDALPLAAAIAFVALLSARAAACPPRPDLPHLRPPPRAPPARA